MFLSRLAKWLDKCSTIDGVGDLVMTVANEDPDTRRIHTPGTLEVWLVEDSEADELLMRAALKMDGLNCEFHVSEDGEKAIEFIEAIDRGEPRPRPHVVLLDLNLPRKGGTRVLERIRMSPECARVPVVIVTSSDSPKDKSQVSRLGATRYFQKPLDLMEFMKLGPLVREVVSSGNPAAPAASLPN
jgi:CheY-like chemotaxis protein